MPSIHLGERQGPMHFVRGGLQDRVAGERGQHVAHGVRGQHVRHPQARRQQGRDGGFACPIRAANHHRHGAGHRTHPRRMMGRRSPGSQFISDHDKERMRHAVAKSK